MEDLMTLIFAIGELPFEEKIEAINDAREALHAISPFCDEPVDLVRWVKSDTVYANDYNPNSVAPPEMELLRVSIDADGFTQPIVSMPQDEGREVVDGFHRHRVGKECDDIQQRIKGYLPVVDIRPKQSDKANRIASTIRHNRARGKHQVEAMSEIVMELKKRNWSDNKIAKNLGMDADEVLRLAQITGLSEAFQNQDFSEAWEVDRETSDTRDMFSDVIEDFEADDGERVFHSWEKWECYKAGMYAERAPGMTTEEGEEKYREFLSDLGRFESALKHITSNWKYSCEHYLTNDRMNRIAWLGQASVAHALGIPGICRGGYHKLTDQQQKDADNLALKYLNKWLSDHQLAQVEEKEAQGRTKAELY